MFLDKLQETNPELLHFAFEAHRSGQIMPDTYLLDADAIAENGQKMVALARENGIKLYFMLKQIGRNPRIAQRLMDIGFDGCVAVDYREALLMIHAGIHIGNVGHLVQVPTHALRTILAARPDVVTVYTLEKIRQINRAAGELGLVQPLLLRITDPDGQLYSGQVGGFRSTELPALAEEIGRMEHVTIGGFTTFPALLYASSEKAIVPTSNLNGLKAAMAFAREKGWENLMINVPSASCCASIPLIRALGGNCAEPGHGLTGTTPLHCDSLQPEKVAYAYVSEVSHDFEGVSYCYGGGHYRRGHMAHALVGTAPEDAAAAGVIAPDTESIDYHYELDGKYAVGQTVVMCYRTQVFTVRSDVAVVEGLRDGTPVITRYSPLGWELEKDWQV